MADGWITIGIKANTDKFDKQIKDLETKMKREEDKKIVIGAKLETQTRELEEARKKTDELAEAYQRLKTAQDKTTSGRATPQQFASFQELQNTYGTLEKLGGTFDKALSKQEALEQRVAQTRLQYDNITSKVTEYKDKVESIRIKQQVSEVNRLKKSFNDVSKSIQKSIVSVGKLALGIFGIRSAYMMLRRASSDLASYDEQYATNLEYIRFALAQAIAPVLKYIVNLAATLLQYINMIVNALFGINLFSNASAENFKKMKAGASGVGKAVKEIRKQLLGFDEVNVLTDQSSTGTSAGAGGVGTPSFDLGGLQGEPPEWLKWIADHKDEILAVMAGVASGLLLWKFGLAGIQALGIGIAISGVVYAIEKLIDFMNDPTFENFGGIIQGIAIAIIGVGIAIGSIPAIVAGVVVLIVGTIIKYWNEIKAFFQKGIDWLSSKSDWVRTMFGDTVGDIYDCFVDSIQDILDWFDEMFKSIKGQFSGIVKFLEGVFTGDWNKAWEGIKEGFDAWWQGITGMFNKFKDYLYDNIIKPIGIFFSSIVDWIGNALNSVWTTITNVFNKVVTFIRDTWNNITSFFYNVGYKVGEAIGGAFKNAVNSVLRAIENILNSPIRAVNSLIGVINQVPGINLKRLPTFNLPRLKTGAIINMPNKGTIIGGGRAIGGEAGAEGIIPLTDQQAMAELGREIGRNVLINLTNITNMNGREIGRALKQVQNEQDFAYNT